MKISLKNFLPKYPNIENSDKYPLLDIYDSNDFNNLIYKKKEFYEEKLDKLEDIPENPGVLLKHQKILSRYMSSHTPYDKLLVFHEMGSGKTCTSIAISEKILSETNNITKVLYIARGDAILNNFVNELVFKCTDGKYIPENYEELTDLEKIHRRNKLIRKNYNLKTYETFAKQLSTMTDTQIKNQFSNRVIIIDEIHNIRIQSKQVNIDVYQQFYRLLHDVTNCKVLLLSGTPIKDELSELSSVMNLLLSRKDKLPTQTEFIEEYFTQIGDDYFLKDDKRDKLYNLFKGKISYLKSVKSDVEKIFVGQPMGTLRDFNVVPDYMSDFQYQIYRQAYIKDMEDQTIYSNSRQAILLVYPNGSYGKSGFNKYVIKKKKLSAIIDTDTKQKKIYTYALSPEFRREITGSNNEEKLLKLEKFSSKYAESIRNILRAREQGKSVFIYNEFVEGSGLIVFSLILNMFGFSKAGTNIPENSQKARYAIISNLTSNTLEIKKLITRFNQPDNMNGEIINVIIGSRVISEGFSLKNVQVEEIHTPWFNYSETSQAIARGYRFGSHQMLIKNNIQPQVEIFQRISVNRSMETQDIDVKSIDLVMYEISEIKDKNIKRVERFIIESSFDCALNYNRNKNIDEMGRDCEYMDCDFMCRDVELDFNLNELDLSSYNIYYQDKLQLINLLKVYLQKQSICSFPQLFSYISDNFQQYNRQNLPYILLDCLYYMINLNVKIQNKYGFVSYLREYKNIYYLTTIIESNSEINSSVNYYNRYLVTVEGSSFSDIVSDLNEKSHLSIIEKVFRDGNISDIGKLPVLVQEFLLENTMLSDSLKKDEILQYFSKDYEIKNQVVYSYLLYKNNQGSVRCLKDNSWEDCDIPQDDDMTRKMEMVIRQKKYAFIGQYNSFNKIFCIRDISKDIPDKKNQQKSGKNCMTWKKNDLLTVVLKNNIKLSELNLDDTGTEKIGKFTTKNQLIDFIKSKNKLDDIELRELETDILQTIVLFLSVNIRIICKYLKEWFVSKDILFKDNNCGVQTKKK